MIVNSTTRVGNLNLLNENMKSARSVLVDLDLERLLLNLKSCGINLPKKAIDVEVLVKINLNDSIVLKKPDDPRRIGVGYKDKGSLGLPGSGYDPDQISPFIEGPSDNLFIKLLSNYRKEKFLFK